MTGPHLNTLLDEEKGCVEPSLPCACKKQIMCTRWNNKMGVANQHKSLQEYCFTLINVRACAWHKNNHPTVFVIILICLLDCV